MTKCMKWQDSAPKSTNYDRRPIRNEAGWVFSYSVRDNVINEVFLLGFCDAVVLLVAFPKIHEQTKRHHPKLLLRQVEMGNAVIK